MSKLIPAGIKGKELFKFLRENKAALIAEKKSIMKTTGSLIAQPSIFRVTKAGLLVKAADDPDADDMDLMGDKIHVTVVCNAMNWCDSHMDVLVDDCAKKKIKERQGLIAHLHDHVQMITGKVGEPTKVYLKDIALRDLGYDADGSTQCIIMESDVYKSYDEKIFNQYKLGKINQHSIGLWYVKLSLCINDEDSEKEFDFWNKYYPIVINKDVVDERGYFWVVNEIKLLENSAVLFGSNELTPTLRTSEKAIIVENTEAEPEQSTQKQPLTESEFLEAKGMAMCTDCFSMWDTDTSNKCPSCGKFTSPSSTSTEVNVFDTLSAETNIFNNLNF